MPHSLAAYDLAHHPDDGVSLSRQASRRGERVASSRLPSYLTAMMIAAGLLFAWAGFCWI
jgi:hypothetical protein